MFRLQRAFTLLEMMITLAILAALIGFGVPGIQSQVSNSKSRAAGDTFSTLLTMLRTEAVKRSTRVSVCASSDGSTCTGSWKDGYIMFVDYAESDDAAAPLVQHSTTHASDIFRVGPKFDSSVSISATRNSAAITFVRFTAIGTLAPVGSVVSSVVMDVSATGCKGSTGGKSITIGPAGIITIDNKSC